MLQTARYAMSITRTRNLSMYYPHRVVSRGEKRACMSEE